MGVLHETNDVGFAAVRIGEGKAVVVRQEDDREQGTGAGDAGHRHREDGDLDLWMRRDCRYCALCVGLQLPGHRFELSKERDRELVCRLTLGLGEAQMRGGVEECAPPPYGRRARR